MGLPEDININQQANLNSDVNMYVDPEFAFFGISVSIYLIIAIALFFSIMYEKQKIILIIFGRTCRPN
jgi:hypothetical protein